MEEFHRFFDSFDSVIIMKIQENKKLENINDTRDVASVKKITSLFHHMGKSVNEILILASYRLEKNFNFARSLLSQARAIK